MWLLTYQKPSLWFARTFLIDWHECTQQKPNLSHLDHLFEALRIDVADATLESRDEQVEAPHSGHLSVSASVSRNSTEYMLDTIAPEPEDETGSFANMHLSVVEDIPGELDEFVRFYKGGDWLAAEYYFDDVLKEHKILFPVAAEYADFLLAQGNFAVLYELANSQMSLLAANEEDPRYILFQLYAAIASIYTGAKFEDALRLALSARPPYAHLTFAGTGHIPDVTVGIEPSTLDY